MAVSKELLARYKELKAKGINISLAELKAGVNDATSVYLSSQTADNLGVNDATSVYLSSQTADNLGVNDATSAYSNSQTTDNFWVNDANSAYSSSQVYGSNTNTQTTAQQNFNSTGNSTGNLASDYTTNMSGMAEDSVFEAESVNTTPQKSSEFEYSQSSINSGWSTTYSNTNSFNNQPSVQTPSIPFSTPKEQNFSTGEYSHPSFSIEQKPEANPQEQHYENITNSPSQTQQSYMGNFIPQQNIQTPHNLIGEDTINAPVKKFGLIGYPLGHSLSTYIHNAGFKSLGIKASYEILETPPDSLVDRIKFFKTNNYLGFNVTIPLKLPVTMFLDEIDASADIVNAVNTVKINPETKELKGYNTDAPGFRNAIPQDFELCGKVAGILGTGGAARAAITALAQSHIKEIKLFTRNVPNSIELLNYLRKTFPNVEFNAYQIEQIRDLSKINLLVNTTPIGMQGRAADMTPVEEHELTTLPPDALVYDVIYNPKKTILLKLAQKHGYRTINGVDMFIHQAVAAEKIWTGRTPDFKDMKIAALENL